MAKASCSYVQSDTIRLQKRVLGVCVCVCDATQFATGFETQTEGIDECDASEPYPWHVSFCGDLDLAGHPKPQAAYRSVLWGRQKLALAVHKPMPQRYGERIGSWGWPEERDSWTWPGAEGTMVHVHVYAKDCCTDARLLINGKVVGPDATVSFSTQYTATFTVPFYPGNITAVGLHNGSTVPGSSVTITTAGPVARLRLDVDRCPHSPRQGRPRVCDCDSRGRRRGGGS